MENKKIICKTSISNNKAFINNDNERNFEWSNANGKTSIQKIEYSGISFNNYKFHLLKPQRIEIISDHPFIEIDFLLNGTKEVYIGNQATKYKENTYNISFYPEKTYEILPLGDINSEKTLEWVSIQLTKEYFLGLVGVDNLLFQQFTQKVEKNKYGTLYENPQALETEIKTVLHDIIACESVGVLKNLFVRSEILKILVLLFQRMASYEYSEETDIKPYDIEKLHLFKQYVQNNYMNDHTLPELSIIAGVNEFKLKRGFKKLFGQTVFGYVNDLKMQKAREMLQSSEKSINEISSFCGYTYPQSFITAFKKKYHITPLKFRALKND